MIATDKQAPMGGAIDPDGREVRLLRGLADSAGCLAGVCFTRPIMLSLLLLLYYY